MESGKTNYIVVNPIGVVISVIMIIAICFAVIGLVKYFKKK